MVAPERLSRFLSFLLRHKPPGYPLEFDERGFVLWDELLSVVRERFPEATESDLERVVQDSEKRRFERVGDRVRATYGHSFRVELGLEPVEPPHELFHGTARDLARNVLRDGLKPRDRQFVHLSPTIEEAIEVGKRRDPYPAVLVVDCPAAKAAGVAFYRSGPVFLAKEIPARFLSLLSR
jgi:putative RNA 2'-phosphotransferase